MEPYQRLFDRDTADRIEALLRGLPQWGEPSARRTFVERALWNHPDVVDRLRLEGSADQAAGALVVALGRELPADEAGETPLCALFDALRRTGVLSAPALDALTGQLGCEQRRDDRPRWHGEPYPGLPAFQRHQAPIFFGREPETQALLDLIGGAPHERMLVVIGASGSGKSSLVRAGLWAKLADGTAATDQRRALAGSEDWLIADMLPTRPEPFYALVSGLTQSAGASHIDPSKESKALRAAADDPARFRLLLDGLMASRPAQAWCLLILDQMEELFTPACASDVEPFLRLLQTTTTSIERFRVIATVRSDFYPRLEQDPWLQPLLNRAGGHYSVGQPGALALERMIRLPVAALRLDRPMAIEPALTERLIGDCLAAPGRLALLAFALRDLYRAAAAVAGTGEPCMTLARYEQGGGLEGILKRRANGALRAFLGQDTADGDVDPVLDDTTAELIRRVFSRLVTVHPDGTPTRRRRPLSDWNGDTEALALIGAFEGPDARLLVGGSSNSRSQPVQGCDSGKAEDGERARGDAEAWIEVAHEALFRAWPLLAGWIGDCKEALIRADACRRDAERWRRRGYDDVLLPKPVLIDDLHRLLAKAGLWDDLIGEPLPARFLARDDADELARLCTLAWDDARAGPSADRISDPATALPLLRTLTNEGRRRETLQGLGEWLAGQDPRLAHWLRAGLDRVLALLAEPDQLPWFRRRPAIGDLLAVLGDDRPGVGLSLDGLPAIAWQQVPRGTVTRGNGDTRTVGPFRIGRYPITNAQWQTFVQADDYDSDAWWCDGIAAPDQDNRPDSRFPQPNRPRTNVAWLEALPFCRWLTARLQAAGELEDNAQVRLPTEDEWLLAAGGSDGRDYPWGGPWEPGIANCDESQGERHGLNLAQTTAVGLYPRGASPFGLFDCAGNVWEWCLNKYQAPDDTSVDTESQRALRGGGWNNPPSSARVSVRNRNDPNSTSISTSPSAGASVPPRSETGWCITRCVTSSSRTSRPVSSPRASRTGLVRGATVRSMPLSAWRGASATCCGWTSSSTSHRSITPSCWRRSAR